MIRYALKCAEGHRFESWFQSADRYDALAKAGHVSCAICGSAEVEKELMAPRVSARDAASDPEETRPLSRPKHPAEQALAALRAHVEKTSTWVGRDFVRKAREMHLGEAPKATIHGEARPEEARALVEEGIPVTPLPFRPTDRSN